MSDNRIAVPFEPHGYREAFMMQSIRYWRERAEAAERDTARLDWCLFRFQGTHAGKADMRAAIDAAMPDPKGDHAAL